MRARTCSLLFARGSSDPYVLNLIDTPGMSYEIQVSLLLGFFSVSMCVALYLCLPLSFDWWEFVPIVFL